MRKQFVAATAVLAALLSTVTSAAAPAAMAHRPVAAEVVLNHSVSAIRHYRAVHHHAPAKKVGRRLIKRYQTSTVVNAYRVNAARTMYCVAAVREAAHPSAWLYDSELRRSYRITDDKAGRDKIHRLGGACERLIFGTEGHRRKVRLRSDAQNLATWLETMYTDNLSYPADLAAVEEGNHDGYSLHPHVSIAEYQVSEDDSSYQFCLEHDRGGYVTYDSAGGGITAIKAKGTCAAA